MLKSLYIKNVALIDEVRISFAEGFNVFTGETGAGKSILIDAINLLLGGKADKNIIKAGKSSAKVEAVFSIDDNFDNGIYGVFDELGLEKEETLSLCRVLNDSGKSEYRLNGEICTLHMFKKISNLLLDIFGQHDNQQLLNNDNHISYFDMYVGNSAINKKRVLADELQKLSDINKQINSLGGDERYRAREIELLEYEINQIEEVDIKLNEDDELACRKKVLVNAEKIYNSLTGIISQFTTNHNLVDIFKQSGSVLGSLSGIDDEIDSCKSRLDSLRWETEDIVETLENVRKKIVYDENELTRIDDRLDQINTIKRKFGSSIEDVLSYYEKAKEKLDLLKNCDENLVELKNIKNNLLENIFNIAKDLHDMRVSKFKEFESKIVSELVDLGMKNAKFEIRNNYKDDLVCVENNITKNGLDDLEFLFSANLGQTPKSLDKIISGGELSRFCLAFKTILNIDDKDKTLIFDEIDAGIGGNTGSVVAKKIATISKKNQVLCITHLAQIASFADSHFKITKYEVDDATYTNIDCLKENEKESEISRMIGYIDNSNYANLHSKELLAESKKYKQLL